MPSRYRTSEGFQTASQTPAELVQKCPEKSIKSFPVKLGITPTNILYDSVNEPITMDIQWATRAVAPSFSNKQGNDGIIDEVGAGNTNLTTLQFRGTQYTVASVQLSQKTHDSWVLPQNSQAANNADIIITFSANNQAIQYKYIVFVIPLIESSSTTDPNYITGLANPSANGPFSLRSVFPEDKNALFAYYSTCMKGYSDTKIPENVYVFIAVNGVPVSATTMTQIKTENRLINYPNPIPPFMSRLEDFQKVIGNDFTSYVFTTTQLLNFQDIKKTFKNVTKVVREDGLDAYKCVALDPDKDVLDGKLRVDIDSGELLQNIVEERKDVRAADQLKGSMDPGRLEKYLGSALGILLSILLFGSMIYLVVTWWIGSKPTAYQELPAFGEGGPPSSPAQGSWVQSFSTYGLMALVAGFVGFIIGAMLA